MTELNLKSIPKSPGIYQFFNKDGKIIYIGKSINLFNRVNSYFNSKTKLNFSKKKMVSEIVDIKTIVVNNEKESLILETTLIKKYKPKYNILMKDDKNHLYIKITDEEIPKVIKTRIKTNSGTYYGPYLSSNYVSNILKITKKIFGYRSCNIQFKSTPLTKGDREFSDSTPLINGDMGVSNSTPLIKGARGFSILTIKSTHGTKIPCIDYYTKRCAGPCLLGEKEISEYKKSIENIKNFINGNFRNVINDLQEKMFKKARELKFEEALKIKKDIESIKSLEENQIVREAVKGDYEVINYLKKYDKLFIGLVSIRDGKINDLKNYEIETHLGESIEEILLEFIEREIVIKPPYPPLSSEKKYKQIILLPIEIIKNGEMINEVCSTPLIKGARGFSTLQTYNGGPITNYYIEIPKSGPKHDLLKFVYKNLYEYAYKKHLDSLSTKGFTKQTMKNLLSLLGYKEINKDLVFECNDISHLSGSYTVASRSVIENGKPAKNKYRKYNIKTLPDLKIDDFASMKEIITRRLKELIEKGNLPDLIIIDGGVGQLNAVLEVIEEYKKLTSLSYGDNAKDPLNNFNITKLSKRDSSLLSEGQLSEIQGRFPSSMEGQISDNSPLITLNSLQLVSIAKKEEELFLPGIKEPIILSKDNPELRLIQTLRDEAHRFAITFNREKRLKSEKKNLLESIPGIGPKTRSKLTKTYGNIHNLKGISKEELQKILSKNQIEALEDHGII